MSKIKTSLKRTIIRIIPNIIWDYYRKLKYNSKVHQMHPSQLKSTFTDIYKSNFWNSAESFSGTGSDDTQTEAIRFAIPKLIEKYSIKSMLDVPCGDFNWMRKVDLTNTQYIGGDIVDEMIQRNNVQYENRNITFKILNLLEDILPEVDLLFCRDCLVHFSYEDINKALVNIRKSNCKYILTTSFIKRRINFNIKTGDWRPINLLIRPFNFPKPLEVIDERCTEGNGKSYDKSLLLFRVSELPILSVKK